MSNDGNEEPQSCSTLDSVSKNCCLISELPMSLLHEIFFKLPIKGIMRCKCVSPTWNNQLSNPSFTQKYAKNSPFTAVLLRIDTHLGALVPLHLCLLEVSHNGATFLVSRIPQKSPQWMSRNSFTYIRPSNEGLLCMKHHLDDWSDAVCVNNPIMGDTIQLPSCPEHPDYNCIVKYEFGFSPVTNKFKVLRFVLKSHTDFRIVECEVFTIGVDRTWRRLSGPFPSLTPRFSFVALNGFFYWLDRGPDFISTFDLGEEKFGRISVPPPGLLLSSKLVYLVVIGDQLCVVDSFRLPSQVTIWKMKKDLAVESWTKAVILTSWFPSKVPTYYLIAVGGLRNGDILFHCPDDSLVSCNVERKRCSKITCLGNSVGRYVSNFMPGYSPNFSLHASHLSRSDMIIKREIHSAE